MTNRLVHWSISVFACGGILCGSAALGDVPMAVTTSAFQRILLTAHKIGDTGIEGVDAGGQGRRIAMADLVAADREDVTVSPTSGLIVRVSGGYELPGVPVGLTERGIMWQSLQLGELTLPMSAVQGIARASDKPQLTRSSQDVVRLNNGDLLKGILASADSKRLVLQGDQGELPVDWTAVAEVSLADTGPATSPAVPEITGAYRLSLRDGSVWPVDGITLQDDRFTIRLHGAAAVTLAPADIRSFEVEGGKITWLARRSPTRAEYTPFFQVSAARPAAYTLINSLRIGNDAFRTAIRVRPLSRLTYAIPTGTASFRGRYIIAGNAPLADVTVRLRAGDKVLYEQAHVKSGVMSPPITADLAGAQTLTLEVDYGANQDVQDDFLWLDPALVKAEPK